MLRTLEYRKLDKIHFKSRGETTMSFVVGHHYSISLACGTVCLMIFFKFSQHIHQIHENYVANLCMS